MQIARPDTSAKRGALPKIGHGVRQPHQPADGAQQVLIAAVFTPEKATPLARRASRMDGRIAAGPPRNMGIVKAPGRCAGTRKNAASMAFPSS